MACFVAPVTEAVVTTIIKKSVDKKAEKEHKEIKNPFIKRLNLLNNMLWGGSALLAFEHIWHGEVTPWFPFLTNMSNPSDAAQMFIVGKAPEKRKGKTVIATGGTSDMPVAEEAALTAEFWGNNVVRLYDVGVAGIHRLLSHTEDIMSAKAIIAIAGMEGALASVIGGLADCPVIAVPTSVGYGAAFGGLAALLSMLNSCASGVSVVNIDNGFGAAYQASMINRIGE